MALEKEVPYCTIFLVFGALAAHFAVLWGNYETAATFNAMGNSTAGWANVGVDVGQSLKGEMDELMTEVTSRISDTIVQIQEVQSNLDMLLSQMGTVTDSASEAGVATAKALLQQPHTRTATMTVLQIPGLEGPDDLESKVNRLGPLVQDAVLSALERLVGLVMESLDNFLVIIRPTLERVGAWLLQFGDRIQAGIDTFSNSLDKVQKIFDQIMAEMDGGGQGEDIMLENTFTLFDVSNSGGITREDLANVAELYSIQALQGPVSGTLLHRYDVNGDGQLNREEFAMLVHDAAIPGAMATVLRAYARQLAQVGGQMGQARTRDEVAQSLVGYLQLVCAKNQTKVGWMAEALTNGSLPMGFSGAVLVQLALSEDDSNVPASASVGGTVIGAMTEMDSDYVLEIVDLISNSTFFESQGYNLNDQPVVLGRVTGWVSHTGHTSLHQAVVSRGEGRALGESLSQVSGEVLRSMPSIAQELSARNVAKHLHARRSARSAKRRALTRSPSSQHLYLRLLGGGTVLDTVGNSEDSARVVSACQPARPETLQFAQWLSTNATRNAGIFQQYCADYTSTSSSAIDSFATQLKGMTNKVKMFLNMMLRYSTPDGIRRLEQRVMDFADHAAQGISDALSEQVDTLVNDALPEFGAGLQDAIDQASTNITARAAEAMKEQVSNALAGSLEGVAEQMMGGGGAGGALPPIAANLSSTMADNLAEQLINATTHSIEEQIRSKLTEVVGGALDSATAQFGGLQTQVGRTPGPVVLRFRTSWSVMQVNRKKREAESLLAVRGPHSSSQEEAVARQAPDANGVFSTLVNQLQSLSNVLPTAVQNLKFARKEVMSLSSNLDSIFVTLLNSGPPIFDTIASLYRTLWTAYFACLVPLLLGTLYYGFWASGWFGGPKAPHTTEGEAAGYEAPQTFADRVRVCASSCGACLVGCQDSELCFWSCLLLMQVVVLVVFIVALVLCIIGGVKALVTSGCAQVYILGDQSICGNLMVTLGTFLPSLFGSSVSAYQTEGICVDNNLMACRLISETMMSSTIKSCIGGFVASILSFQMLFDSAMLHERSRWRRIIEDAQKES